MQSDRKLKSVFIFVGLVAAFLVLYQDTIIHIVATWSSNEAAHGPLIVLVSLYLIWLKKDDFKALPRYPAIFWGSLLAGAGCFVLFAGKLSSTMLLQQISMIPFLLGTILLLRGCSYFKALFLPVVYLIFVTGFIETLLSSLAIYLQHASAWIAVQLFKLIGMPAVLTGIIIDLPHIALEVARGCSGVSHLVAIMALSIPLGIISKLPPLRKIFLVCASFIIGLYANGFRIFLIGVYALYNKGADLHGPNETLAVSVIFLLGMILLVILNHFLRPRHKEKYEEQKENADVATDISNEEFVCAGHIHFRNAWIITVGLVAVTFGFVQFYKLTPMTLNTPLNHFVSNIDDSDSKPLQWIDQKLRPFPADDELLRTYDQSGYRIDAYVGYFEEQTRERKLIDYRRSWMHEGAQKITVDTADGTVTINQTRERDDFPPTDIYFWYVMDGRIVTSQYFGKFYTFFDGLFKRRTNGAVVVVQSSNSHEEVMPFLKDFIPAVNDFISHSLH